MKKNEKLKEERGISFEEVLDAMFADHMFGTAPHPNQKRYRGQQMFLIEVNDYVYVVPFVEDIEKIFLKTVFPSRKYTKQYLEKEVL